MLRTFKSAIERAIVLSGATSVWRKRHCDDVLILAYHNIVPDGEFAVGDISLHLSQRSFAQQLDSLKQTHEVIAINELSTPTQVAMRAHVPTKKSKPLAIITFDDAYRGALTAGVKELQKRHMPATMFVAPAYLGGKSFWWDVLTPANSQGLPYSFREHALTTNAGKDAMILDRANQALSVSIATMPLHARCVTEDELSSALSFDQLLLGSHTWSHPNLTALPADELQHEMHAPKAWLLDRYGKRFVSAISYPYGRANQTVWDAARSADYSMGFLIDGGWAQRSMSSVFTIPRLNIPSGVSSDGFALRASGVISA